MQKCTENYFVKNHVILTLKKQLTKSLKPQSTVLLRETEHRGCYTEHDKGR